MEHWSVVKEKQVFEPLLHHSGTPIIRKYSELKAIQRFGFLLGYRIDWSSVALFLSEQREVNYDRHS